MDRGERRARTLRVALRRQAQHRRTTHRPGSNFRCFCDGCGPHLFDKRTPWTHNCRKRKYGQPKRGWGICHLDGRSHIIEARQLTREIRRLKEDPKG